MKPNQDILSVTAFFSVLIHAAVILGVSFKLPDIANLKNTDNTLDVILLSNSNNKVDDDATYIGAADNLGGGTDEVDGSAKMPFEQVDPSPIDSIKLTAQQQSQTALNPDSLLTSNQASLVIQRETPKKTQLEIKPKTKGKDKLTTKSLKQREKQRLLRKIASDREAYLKRPRKTFISPSTKSHEAAGYQAAWRKKVEKIGTANYPVEAKAKGLTGSVSLSIEIKRDGTISLIHTDKASKHKILTDAALRIVRRASPFARFPEEMLPNTDIMVISRVFHFLPGNTVTTTDARGEL